MTPLPLRLAARLLPRDAGSEVVIELLERYSAIAVRDGRAAADRWAWRQPCVALAARFRWGLSASRAPLFRGIPNDISIAVRAIGRRPGVAVAVISTVAISIGALSATTGVIDAVLLRPLPYPDQGRLVWLKPFSMKSAPSANPAGWANPNDVADWAARAKTLTAVTAIERFESTLMTPAAPLRVKVAVVNATVGEVLGIRAAVGRLFTTDDYAPGTHVLVLSYAVWHTHFSSDLSIVGRSIVFAGSPFTVVGILPDTPLQFPEADTDLWLPLRPPAAATQRDERNRNGVWQHAAARVRPDHSVAEAQAEMTQIARALGAEFPKTNADRGVLVQPFRDGTVGSTRQILVVLGGAVAMVLLIACANIGHLLLVTAQGRRREFSLRAALGASRWRIARLTLVESAMLCAAGGFAGALLAGPLLRAFLYFYPDPLPSVGQVTISRVAVIVALASTAFAALAAVLPPLFVARVKDLSGAMRATDRGSDSPGQRRVRTTLVVVQIAMSTALLVGGGLLVRTFWDMRGTTLGFTPDRLLTFNVALADRKYPTVDDEARFYDDLLDRLRVLPGVSVAGASSLLPLGHDDFKDSFVREGMNDEFPNLPTGRLQVITPGFLEALGLQLRGGRTVQAIDTSTSARVAVVNQAMEQRYFPSGAVGRRIRFRGHSVEIVGVVSDKRHADLREAMQADLYVPRTQSDNPRLFGWVLIRSTSDADQLAPAVRNAVRAVDPGIAVAGLQTMTERVQRALAPDRFRAILVGSLSGVALLLAAIGLYGLIAYSVALGTRDIAIRMALGASASHTVGAVLRQVLLLTVTGIAAGVAFALAGTLMLEQFLVGVTTHDPLTLVAVVMVLLVVALIAATGPAVRAGRIDPIRALRAS